MRGDPNCSVAFLGEKNGPGIFGLNKGTHLNTTKQHDTSTSKNTSTDSDDAVGSTTLYGDSSQQHKIEKNHHGQKKQTKYDIIREEGGSLLHLRIFQHQRVLLQHTPATYPRHPSNNSLCFGIHFMSGVNFRMPRICFFQEYVFGFSEITMSTTTADNLKNDRQKSIRKINGCFWFL